VAAEKLLWSAPAERSGDGALDAIATKMLRNQKRRRRFALPAHSKGEERRDNA